MRDIGRYKIERPLGAGGMGQVYKAIDGKSGEPVAIKIIKGRFAADEAARIRFVREARAAGQLRHPHIVTIRDFGQERGALYMVMEYLRGAPLSTFIPGPPALSLRRKLLLMTQCAEALGYAHSHGIFHRDIKPANILVLTDKSAKLVDFGLAGIANLPNSLVQGGTPPYMAPEQFERRDSDGGSDIWSLAITLFELLTGRLPFRSVDDVRSAPAPKLPPDFPFATDLNVILGLSLGKDRRMRYSTAERLAIDLRMVREKCERAGGIGSPGDTPRVHDLPSEKTPPDATALGEHGAAPATALEHLNTDPSPPLELPSPTGNAVLSDLGFARPVSGELKTRAGNFRWAARITKLRAARYGAFTGISGKLHIVIASALSLAVTFAAANAPRSSNSVKGLSSFLGLATIAIWIALIRLVVSASIQIASLLAVLENIPVCKGCRLHMQRTTRWTRVCSTREEVTFGYRDCLGALKHRLWNDAAMLLSMYGAEREPYYVGWLVCLSARYHISFFECRLCGHHAARLTTDEPVEREWEQQPRFHEAYWGTVANNRPPLLAILAAVPNRYFTILPEMGACLAASGWKLAMTCVALVVTVVLAGGLARVTFGVKFPSVKNEVIAANWASARQTEAISRAMHISEAFPLLRGGGLLVSKENGRVILSLGLDDSCFTGPQHEVSPVIIAGVDETLQRIAPSISAFPAEADILDSARHVRKSLQLGKAAVGSKYTVYYIGPATRTEAASLGDALTRAGYWDNSTFPVVLSKTGTTAIGFVLGADLGYMANYFERLVRAVAPLVGGLPIEMRLINAEMMTRRRITVR